MMQNAFESSKKLIRVVLPLMVKHNIPMTPQNYSVWYAYAAGENGELQKVLDTMIHNREPFTDTKLEMLYKKFVLDLSAIEITKSFQDELLQILHTVLKEMAEINGRTDLYGSLISDSVGLLSEDKSLQEIKAIVNFIIAESRAVLEFGNTTKNKIQTVTSELQRMQAKFESACIEASTDFLTKVANRKSFNEAIEKLTSEADLSSKGLCLMIVDIDHFKKFNDEHGHLVGDEVLKFVAQKIKNQVKGNDFVARLGGEEFAILLPNTTLEGAKSVAENILLFFSQTTLKTVSDKKLGKITVSIGVANFSPGETPEKLIQRADDALYIAKAEGRNRMALSQLSQISPANTN
jgi:diguanylate cyclase